MIGAKQGKSDVCLAQQFVRGLSSAFKTHTLSMGPETFDAAVHAATLYQNAQKAAVASDAGDDRIFSLQKAVAELQKKSDPCPEVDQPLQSTQTIPDAFTRGTPGGQRCRTSAKTNLCLLPTCRPHN